MASTTVPWIRNGVAIFMRQLVYITQNYVHTMLIAAYKNKVQKDVLFLKVKSCRWKIAKM